MGRRRSESIYAKSLEDYMESLVEASNLINKPSSQLEEGEVVKLFSNNENNFSTLVREEVETEISAERELVNKLEILNRAYKSGEKSEEKIESLDVLSSFFKERMGQIQEDQADLILFSAVKTRYTRAMSENAIYEINMKEALDTIIKRNEETENEENSETEMNNKRHRSSLFSNDSTSTTLSREVLAQNVECEDTIKVMLVGSTHTGKTKLINNFLECRKNKYIPSNGLEIKKKLVKIFGKTTRVEFFDTDAHFHLQTASRIYYRICDAFLYVVDCLKPDTLEYIQTVHNKIFDHSSAKNFVLLAVNFSMAEAAMKHNLLSFAREYNIRFFDIKNVDNFFIKDVAVYNLFSAMVIKKRKTKRRPKWFKSNHGINSFNEPDSKCEAVINSEDTPKFGFNEMYQIESYAEEKRFNGHKSKRRWSFYEVY